MFAFGNYGKGLKGLYSFSFGPELTCTSAGKLLVPEHCTWGTWDMRQGNLSLHRWNDQDRASKVWRQAVKTLSWHSFPILLGGNTFFFLLFSAINMLLRRCMEQLVQTVDRLWLRPGFVVKHSLCFSSTCQESSRPRYFRHSLQWWRDWAVWQSFKNKQTSCAFFPQLRPTCSPRWSHKKRPSKNWMSIYPAWTYQFRWRCKQRVSTLLGY